MKKLLFSSLVLAMLMLTACGGKSDKPKDETENTDKEKAETGAEKGNKTAQHVKVPETNLYIIPPAGFAVDTLTQQLSNGYPNFMRMRFLSGYTIDNFFSGLKKQAEIDFPGSWKEDKFTVQGHEAIIFTYKNAAVIQYYLVFPDHFSEDMILATHEEKDMATGKDMYAALKTVVVEK